MSENGGGSSEGETKGDTVYKKGDRVFFGLGNNIGGSAFCGIVYEDQTGDSVAVYHNGGIGVFKPSEITSDVRRGYGYCARADQ